MLVDAIRQTFDQDYPVQQLRDIRASIEFPVKEQDYPSFWVDFTPQGPLQRAGVAHVEFEGDPAAGYRAHTRWVYDGLAQWTAVSLTSLERDRMHDELVRVFAFGEEHESTSAFRAIIEDNPFIACNINFDEVSVQGSAASPGTPWGSEDILYEVTLSLRCTGEFVSDSQSGTLAALEEVRATTWALPDETDPTVGDGLGEWG